MARSRFTLGVSPGEWSYTGNPASSNRDAVRSLIGDIDPSEAQVSNQEIDWSLTQESGVYSAAARCCEMIAAYYARKITVSTGGQNSTITENWGELFEHYRDLGAQLRTQASTTEGSSGGSVYCGGISIADKQSNEGDSDRVPPMFHREMLDTTAPTNWSTSDEANDAD